MINHTIYFSSHSIIPASPIPSFYYLFTSCSPHSIIPTPPILLIILSLLLLFFSFYYPCSSYSTHSIIPASYSTHSIILAPPILLILLSMLYLFYSFYYPCSFYSTLSIIPAPPILFILLSVLLLFSLISSYIPPAPPIPPTISLSLFPILLNIPLHLLFPPPSTITLRSIFTYPEGIVQQLALPTSLFTKIRDQNAVTLTLIKLANIIKYFFSCFSIIDYCSTGCSWLRCLGTKQGVTIYTA